MSRSSALWWWIGVVVSTSVVLVGAFDSHLWHLPPETPFDNIDSSHAVEWRFLDEASAIVAAGSTFTVHAPDTDTEMSLYMMSVGLLPKSTPIPTSYYGGPVAASAAAEFVLSYGIEADETTDSDCTIAIAGGYVTVRGQSRK